MTRDDLKWTVLMVLAVIASLALLSESVVRELGLPLAIVPWLPWCRLVTMLAGVVGAKLGNSPLPGKADAPLSQSTLDKIAASVPIVMIAALLGLAAFTMPSCAATRPPAGTYSTAGLKAFDADQLLKDITALSETAVNLNATSGPLHLKDRDTALVRDFALSAGAGLVSYGNGSGSLAIVVSAFDDLSRSLSAEAALNDKLRFVLALVADNIHRIPGQ